MSKIDLISQDRTALEIPAKGLVYITGLFIWQIAVYSRKAALKNVWRQSTPNVTIVIIRSEEKIGRYLGFSMLFCWDNFYRQAYQDSLMFSLILRPIMKVIALRLTQNLAFKSTNNGD